MLGLCSVGEWPPLFSSAVVEPIDPAAEDTATLRTRHDIATTTDRHDIATSATRHDIGTL